MSEIRTHGHVIVNPVLKWANVILGNFFVFRLTSTGVLVLLVIVGNNPLLALFP